jgi:hypothetical protein
MLQQRDAKIAELSRLVNALSPPKVRNNFEYFSSFFPLM